MHDIDMLQRFQHHQNTGFKSTSSLRLQKLGPSLQQHDLYMCDNLLAVHSLHTREVLQTKAGNQVTVRKHLVP